MTVSVSFRAWTRLSACVCVCTEERREAQLRKRTNQTYKKFVELCEQVRARMPTYSICMHSMVLCCRALDPSGYD